MAADPPTDRPPLDGPSIVAVASALADEEGIDALTMRRVAERLGFKVMSLYNHVDNKDALLRRMVDAVAEEIAPPHPDATGLGAVRALAIEFRNALVRHPWASDQWNRHVPGPARSLLMEHLLRLLADSGLPDDLAHHGFHATVNHVLGYTLQEQAMTTDRAYGADPMAVARDFVSGLDPAIHPHTIAHVHQHLAGDTESSFELVLDLILDGLAALAAAR